MTKHFLIAFALACTQTLTLAQTTTQKNQMPAPPRPTSAPPPRANSFDLSDYGVQFAPDQRLIVVMAALDAAGFEPTPDKQPIGFRAQVRRDQAALEPDLVQRLRRFYELNKLPGPHTPAEQAARYVSLAFALSPPPELEAPARTDDLFPGVLEVLDFAPLVREFYHRSGIEARLPDYFHQYQAAGDTLRPQTAEMVRSALAFLHTRPVTTVTENVVVSSPTAEQKKKAGGRQVIIPREHERRFVVVPDLLAAPGAINLRVIRDDYFLVVPATTDPRTSEVRRAYLQFMIDPLILRYNREIALRRADLKTLLGSVHVQETTPAKSGKEEIEQFVEVTDPPHYDVFTAVARSLVAASDAQMTATARLQVKTQEASARLAKAKEAERAQITQELQAARAAIEAEKIAQLADAYERGAVLALYFADQLREQAEAGFDIGDLFADLIARFDVAREQRRPAEYAAVRERVLAARRARESARSTVEDEPEIARRALLVKNLDEANELLRVKKYDEAETRLKSLMQDYQGEPRIFFALAQVASSSAQDTFDEDLRAERLGRALANYRFAVEHAVLDIDTDRALASRAHTEMGRILSYLERNDEALKEFDAAIQLGDVPNGAYRDALAEKRKLQQP
ncbi:MAG: hypothetical protein DMF64_03830 [Acidobacteria bacterium]|nr:MAG: hypothetical protein DMF64_03830 [Acidobacteriota bacterium]